VRVHTVRSPPTLVSQRPRQPCWRVAACPAAPWLRAGLRRPRRRRTPRGARDDAAAARGQQRRAAARGRVRGRRACRHTAVTHSQQLASTQSTASLGSTAAPRTGEKRRGGGGTGVHVVRTKMRPPPPTTTKDRWSRCTSQTSGAAVMDPFTQGLDEASAARVRGWVEVRFARRCGSAPAPAGPAVSVPSRRPERLLARRRPSHRPRHTPPRP